jgi:hypothetical protein
MFFFHKKLDFVIIPNELLFHCCTEDYSGAWRLRLRCSPWFMEAHPGALDVQLGVMGFPRSPKVSP